MRAIGDTRLLTYGKFSFGIATLVLLCLSTSLPIVAQESESAVRQGAERRVTRYAIIDLGTLGGTFSDTGGVNNRGQVVGGSSVPGDEAVHTFLWNNGVMTDLGTLGGPNSIASAVSDTTRIVGVSDISNSAGNPNLCLAEFVFSSNQCHAFLWENGVMRDLGTLGGDNSSIGALGVNSSGQVAGTAETPTPDPNNLPFKTFHAFLWQRGVMRDLGTLGGANSLAGSINDAGQVVGAADNSSTFHAFLWGNGVMRDLGTLGGSWSWAIGNNNRSQVVGVASTPDDLSEHAFFWNPGVRNRGVMTDLGTLSGDAGSFATDINVEGQVVGWSWDASGNSRGFLWQNGTMTDFNTLIPADSTLQVVTAFQINSRGEIVGTAVEKSTGQTRAYLATPTRGYRIPD